MDTLPLSRMSLSVRNWACH